MKQIVKQMLKAYIDPNWGLVAQQAQEHQPDLLVSKLDFTNISGLEPQKRLLQKARFAPKPISVLIASPPGLGKTELAKCVEAADPESTLWMDGTGLTGAGIKKQIKELHEQGHDEITVIVDEVEKADKSTTNVFLNILEGGRLTKTTHTESYDYKNLHVSLVATCNDLDTLRKKQPALINRIMVIEIHKPDLREFMGICEFRLAKEDIARELAWYIATKTYQIWGPDMREAVRIGVMNKSAEDVEMYIADRQATTSTQ